MLISSTHSQASFENIYDLTVPGWRQKHYLNKHLRQTKCGGNVSNIKVKLCDYILECIHLPCTFKIFLEITI